ncbi:MAG TPA: hypothetical protein VNA12_07850 [Mycobacteriales bacterium]|nr:hypothetical protein [Mycobacteriales bacterium]
MRRLLVVLLLAVGLVPVAGGTAWACSCGAPASEEEKYRTMAEDAAAVYAGTVLDETVDPPNAGPGEGTSRYRIRVDRALKNASPGDVRLVESARSDGICGSQLSPGRVFLDEQPAGRTNDCTGTTQHDVDGEVERYRRYNRPSLPRTGGPDASPSVAVLLVAAALVTAASRGTGARRPAS